MPTYDYHCQACGHRFELFQSIVSDPVTDCPVCGKPEVVRVVTGGSGLIFKGSGFYITDYKKQKSSTNSSKNDSADKSKPDSKKSDTSK